MKCTSICNELCGLAGWECRLNPRRVRFARPPSPRPLPDAMPSTWFPRKTTTERISWLTTMLSSNKWESFLRIILQKSPNLLGREKSFHTCHFEMIGFTPWMGEIQHSTRQIFPRNKNSRIKLFPYCETARSSQTYEALVCGQVSERKTTKPYNNTSRKEARSTPPQKFLVLYQNNRIFLCIFPSYIDSCWGP